MIKELFYFMAFSSKIARSHRCATKKLHASEKSITLKIRKSFHHTNTSLITYVSHGKPISEPTKPLSAAKLNQFYPFGEVFITFDSKELSKSSRVPFGEHKKFVMNLFSQYSGNGVNLCLKSTSLYCLVQQYVNLVHVQIQIKTTT